MRGRECRTSSGCSSWSEGRPSWPHGSLSAEDARFKNADAIGHPVGVAFNQFISAFGFICGGAGTPFVPYLLSTFDTLAWRYNVPEALYPEALVPGQREIGSRAGLALWGNV